MARGPVYLKALAPVIWRRRIEASRAGHPGTGHWLRLWRARWGGPAPPALASGPALGHGRGDPALPVTWGFGSRCSVAVNLGLFCPYGRNEGQAPASRRSCRP